MSEVRRVFTTNEFKSFDDVRSYFKDNYNLSVRFYPISEDRGNGNNLYRLHYTNNSDLSNPLVKQCKGIILNMTNNEIVCYTSNYVYEYPTESIPELVFDGARVESAVDGTMIRLFYHGSQWHVATNKTLDANWKGARWHARKTFGKMFNEAINFGDREDLDYDRLNQRYAYSFILMHPENRIVHKYTEPNVVHVSTMDLDSLREVETDVFFKNGNLVSKPTVMSDFTSFQSVVDSANDLPYDHEGFIVVYPGSDGVPTRVKVLGKEYSRVRNLKGNSTDMVDRCLDLFFSRQLDEFLNFFPEHRRSASRAKSLVYELVGTIHNEYVNQHVYRHPAQQSKYTEVIQALHDQYKTTRKRVTTKTVKTYLDSLEPAKIKALLM